MSGNRCFGDLDEGRSILEAPKYFDYPVIMQKQNKKPSQCLFSGAPIFETSSDENIVGLSLYFRTHRAPDSFKHSFGLIQRIGNKQNWLYDLCIYPPFQRSHVDKKKRQVFYGSHIHLLDDSLKVDLDYDSCTWLDYLNFFAEQTNIKLTSSTVIEPFAGELLL